MALDFVDVFFSGEVGKLPSRDVSSQYLRHVIVEWSNKSNIFVKTNQILVLHRYLALTIHSPIEIGAFMFQLLSRVANPFSNEK